MADLRLPVWPSFVDCLAWSADCELAIATGSHVTLFIPWSISKAASNDNPSASPWHQVTIKVDIPTPQDPSRDTTPRDHLNCIGEKQSACLVTALAWSPPGLAKHRRSLLGVLTTNHVLTLWSSTKDPKESSSWNSPFVINTSIREALQSRDQDRSFSRLARTQVRSYAWSEACHATMDVQWGVSILAIANEADEIMLLRIVSPHCPLRSSGPRWRLQILAIIPAYDGAAPPPDVLRNVRKRLDQRVTFVDRLHWSPWLQNADGTRVALLAYTHNGVLRVRSVVLAAASSSNDVQPAYSDHTEQAVVGKRIVDSILWYDKLLDGLWTLAVVQKGNVSIVSLEQPTTPQDSSASAPLQKLRSPVMKTIQAFANTLKHWGPMSGMSFIGGHFSTPATLQMISHLSETVAFQWLSQDRQWARIPHRLSVSPKVAPSIHSIIDQRLRTNFSRFIYDRNLGENPLCKVWGLVSSPLEDHIAFAFSLHPTNMIEYAAPVDERTTILFVPHRPIPSASNPSHVLSVDYRASTEAMLFALRNPAEDDETLMADAPDPDSMDMMEQDIPDTSSKQLICTAIQRKSLDNKWAAMLRLAHLVSLNSPPEKRESSGKESADVVDADLLQHHITTVLTIPRTRIGGHELSKKILYAAACVGSWFFGRNARLLQLCEAAFIWIRQEHSLDMTRELDWCSEWAAHREDSGWKHDLTIGADSPRESPSQDRDKNQFLESCGVCEAPLGWAHKPQWVQCTSKHIFSISKYCGVCNKEYLADQILGEDNKAVVDDRRLSDEEETSLARLLFDACDRCVHCGGKFVG